MAGMKSCKPARFDDGLWYVLRCALSAKRTGALEARPADVT